MYTSAYTQVTADLHVSQLVAVVGLSMFIAGLGIGPMFLAPLSEFYGRRLIYLVSFTFFTLFLIPCALARHISVLLIFRFLSGMVGSVFLSVAGGTVGDMFSKSEVGPPMTVFTAATFVILPF
jgi:MFS family permease